MARFCTIIPARMESRRFPGKPLAEVGGKPLLQYAVDTARGTQEEFYVATPDDQIIAWCKERDVPCHFTDPLIFQPENGTERAFYADRLSAKERKEPIVVLQCDEPDLKPEHILRLVEFPQPATIACRMKRSDWKNETTVACRVWGDTILQFKRAVDRNWPDGITMRHVGVYKYARPTLEDYLDITPPEAEQLESLEQIRTMAMGLAFLCCKIDSPLRSINTPFDVEAFSCDTD